MSNLHDTAIARALDRTEGGLEASPDGRSETRTQWSDVGTTAKKRDSPRAQNSKRYHSHHDGSHGNSHTSHSNHVSHASHGTKPQLPSGFNLSGTDASEDLNESPGSAFNENGKIYTPDEMLEIWTRMKANDHFKNQPQLRSELFFSVVPNHPATLEGANGHGGGGNSRSSGHRREGHHLEPTNTDFLTGGVLGSGSGVNAASNVHETPQARDQHVSSGDPAVANDTPGIKSGLLGSSDVPTKNVVTGQPSTTPNAPIWGSANDHSFATASPLNRSFSSNWDVFAGVRNTASPAPATAPVTGSAPPGFSQSANPPEKTNWIYRDPTGMEHGPYTGLVMHGWYASNYFQDSLLIRQADSSEFIQLRDLKLRTNNFVTPFLTPLPAASASQIGPMNPVASPRIGTPASPSPWPSRTNISPFNFGAHHIQHQSPLVGQSPLHSPSVSAPMSPWNSSQTQLHTMPWRQPSSTQLNDDLESGLLQQIRSAALSEDDSNFLPKSLPKSESFENSKPISPIAPSATVSPVAPAATMSPIAPIAAPISKPSSPLVETADIAKKDKKSKEGKKKGASAVASVASSADTKSNAGKSTSNGDVASVETPASEPKIENVTAAPVNSDPPAQAWAAKASKPQKQAPSLAEIQALEKKSISEKKQEPPKSSSTANVLASPTSSPGSSFVKTASASLPTTSSWGKTPVGATQSQPKKSLAQIQKEEEAAHMASATSNNHKTRYADVLGRPSMSYSAASSRVSSSATPSPLPSAPSSAHAASQRSTSAAGGVPEGWATVGRSGKARDSAVTNSSSTPDSADKSGSSQVSSKATPELCMDWCKATLGSKLKAGVNLAEVLNLLFSLPPSADSKEIIADTVYANTLAHTVDGRRFADEFVKRRNGTIEKKPAPNSWSDVATRGPPAVAPVNGGWNDQFTVITKKSKKKV